MFRRTSTVCILKRVYIYFNVQAHFNGFYIEKYIHIFLCSGTLQRMSNVRDNPNGSTRVGATTWWLSVSPVAAYDIDNGSSASRKEQQHNQRAFVIYVRNSARSHPFFWTFLTEWTVSQVRGNSLDNGGKTKKGHRCMMETVSFRMSAIIVLGLLIVVTPISKMLRMSGLTYDDRRLWWSKV